MGVVEAVPLFVLAHSTHACFCLHPQSTTERALSLYPSCAKTDRGACCFFFLFSFCPLSWVHLVSDLFPRWPSDCSYRVGVQKPKSPASAGPLSLFLSICLCSISRHSRVHGEGSGVTPGMKKGWVFWASRQMPALFKSAQWVRPNCLHVLLTPSELQTSKQRHKDKGKRGPRALPHKYICSPDTAECEVFTSPNETDLNNVIMNVTGILLRLFTDMKCSISASCEAL